MNSWYFEFVSALSGLVYQARRPAANNRRGRRRYEHVFKFERRKSFELKSVGLERSWRRGAYPCEQPLHVARLSNHPRRVRKRNFRC